jgi:hypothetical protein
LKLRRALLRLLVWPERVRADVFAARDTRRILPRWCRYEGRHSVLASDHRNRKVERPVNAPLRFGYALVKPRRSSLIRRWLSTTDWTWSARSVSGSANLADSDPFVMLVLL